MKTNKQNQLKQSNVLSAEKLLKGLNNYLKSEESIREDMRIEIGNTLQELYNLQKLMVFVSFEKTVQSGDFGKFQIIRSNFLESIKKDKKFNCFFQDVLGSLKKYLPENIAFVVSIHIITASYNNDSSILDDKNINKILSNAGLVVSDKNKDNIEIILKIAKKVIA